MATIWKFPLPVGDTVTVKMPRGARVLHVAVQGRAEQPTIWAVVDPGEPMFERAFAVRGTGHDLGVVGDYVGTFMLLGGTLVFHVFEAGI